MYKYSWLKNQIIFLVSLCFLFISVPSFSQSAIEGLIMSEVYLDKVEPIKNWIEIFNPNDKGLILQRVRLSHIRTIDVLPPDIRKKGGIEIKAKQHLVLCANTEVFKEKWGKDIDMLELKVLSSLTESGFVMSSTKNCPEEKAAGFRYGDPKISSKIENLLGKQVLKISDNGKSYSRNIVKSESGIEITEFIETNPTPGRIN